MAALGRRHTLEESARGVALARETGFQNLSVDIMLATPGQDVQKAVALADYAASIGLALTVRDDYGLRDFVRAVAGDLDRRCGHCYTCRLEETARYAAANGFASFSTTLLVSPYQDHEGIRQAGEALAERCGVRFLYRDFRPGFRQGQGKARELGLYMQKYCGCVFSEEERYARQIQRDRARFE